MQTVAKLFKNGASQAVRLPQEFRFEGEEVGIKRVGSIVMLFPKDQAWDLMGEALGGMGDDFLADRNQPRRAEKRKPLNVSKVKRS